MLDEVTALVEWPVPLAGRFEERFLSLPREVLISTLEDHQRYFPVEGPDGRLLSHFITVANVESRDPAQVVEGNERVVRPRLADAAFFWDQDRKLLKPRARPGLAKVTFQAKLGSLGDKMRRIAALAGHCRRRAANPALATLQPGHLGTARRGALQMRPPDRDGRRKFPGSFRASCGNYYALADGEESDVATAIREHYQPRAAGDELPATETGTTLAIADRLDTLAGIFAIGEKPTGTKDPFGLRRGRDRRHPHPDRKAARARCRPAVGSRHDTRARGHREIGGCRWQAGSGARDAGIAAEVSDYVLERLRAYYRERTDAAAERPAASITTEMFDAVLAIRPASPLDFDARLAALSTFLTLPEAASLTAANKRVANILRKAGESAPAEVDQGGLQAPAERQPCSRPR